MPSDSPACTIAAILLAGGQSLIPVLKLEMAEPSDLVSLAKINDLRGVRSEPGKLLTWHWVPADTIAERVERRETALEFGPARRGHC